MTQDDKIYNQTGHMFDRSPEMPNGKSDFVTNVNILARNLHLLNDQALYINNTGIQELLAASKSILKEVIDDVHKGATPEGYRKIDFDLEANLVDGKNYIYYEKAEIETTDAKVHEIKFTKPVYSLFDVNFQLMAGIKELNETGKIVNTVVEIVPKKGLFSGMGRIKDSLARFGEFSNVKRVSLFVDKFSMPNAKGIGIYDYFWYDTTSALLTLHTSHDVIMDILNRIEKIYADFKTKYADMLVKHGEVSEWYKEIDKMYKEILTIYVHIKEMYKDMEKWWEETKQNADDAREALDLIRKAVLNSTPYMIIKEDTTIQYKHIGAMLQCEVPLDTDIITLTIPDQDEKGEKWNTSIEILFVPKGKGTVLIKSGGKTVVASQEGTTPMVKGSGRVGCAKHEPDGNWLVFGALEDI